jgi:hypothetical protein
MIISYAIFPQHEPLQMEIAVTRGASKLLLLTCLRTPNKNNQKYFIR